ncbi:MAG: type II toxin-antitoxin system VapC family toxin [Solirubrobacterales bacterium]
MVLDAWAILALLTNEPAAGRVRSLIVEGEAAICAVNLGEVLYSLIRTIGREFADERVAGVRQVVQVIGVDWPLIELAAETKAEGGLSYADAFCVATARARGSALATGDPEILALADQLEVVDLR